MNLSCSVVGTNTEGSDSEELLTGVPATCNVSSPTTESQPILISPVESPQVAADSSSVPAGPTGNDEQPTCGTTKQLSFEVKYFDYIILGREMRLVANGVAYIGDLKLVNLL